MKKIAFILFLFLTSFCSFSFAEDQGNPPPSDSQQQDMPGMQQNNPQNNQGGMMGGQGMMGKGKMGGMGMHPTVVATSDGGVVVLMGNKLAKYDSSLTLIKEVEMKGGPKPMDKKAQSSDQADQPSAPPSGDAAPTPGS